MAGTNNPDNIVALRQEKVEGFLLDGYRPRIIAEKLGVPLRTIERDKKTILTRWEKERSEESKDIRQKNLDEFNRRYWREREHLVDKRDEMYAANDASLAHKFEASIREWDKLYHDVNVKAGKFTNVPQEVVNTLQTGKQFVVEWKGKSEGKNGNTGDPPT